MQNRRGSDDLLVHPVLAGGVDPDRDGLVRLVRDDDALAHLQVALLGRVVHGRRDGLTARLAGATLALLQPVGTPLLRLGAPPIGALLSALLNGPRRPGLTGVERPRALARLLR